MRTVLAMQWTLYRRRAKPGRLVVNILLGLIGLFGAIGVLAAAVGSGVSSSPSAAHVPAMMLAGIGILWAYLPALSGFSDSGLHPRQFVLLPLRPASLARALFVASWISIPVVVTAVASLSVVAYGMARAPLTLLVAIPAVPLTLLLIISVARVVALALSQAAQSRRAREAVMMLFVIGICALYAGQFAVNSLVTSADEGRLGFTLAIPFAWGIAAVARAADGQWLIAVAAVVGLAVLSALTLAVWQWLVRRLFTGAVPVPAVGTSGRQRRGYLRAGWRATATGAVVSRELSLWRGDIRRRYQLLAPIAFAVMGAVLPLALDDFPFDSRWGAWMALLMGVIAGLNLYGLDGKSFWHLAMIPSAMRADVRGRQLAWAVVIAPVCVLSTVIVRAFSDRPFDHLAVPIAVTVSIVGVGAGLAAYASAATPYPVPEARKMMSLSTRNMGGGAAIGWALGTVVVLAVVSVPCALIAALAPQPVNWIGVVLAALIGALGWWWLGNRAIAKVVSRPDLIQYAITRT